MSNAALGCLILCVALESMLVLLELWSLWAMSCLFFVSDAAFLTARAGGCVWEPTGE